MSQEQLLQRVGTIILPDAVVTAPEENASLKVISDGRESRSVQRTIDDERWLLDDGPEV